MTAINWPKPRLAIGLIFTIIGVQYATWTTRLPDYKATFGLDNFGISTLLLSVSIGTLISMPLSSVLLVRFGTYRMLKLATYSFICLFPLFTLGISYEIMLVVGLLLGISTGTIDISMNAQALALERQLKRPILSTFHGLFSAGMFLGAAVATAFIASKVNLATHVVLISLLFLLATPFITGNLLKPKEEADAIKAKEKGGLRFTPFLILLGLISFISMMGEGAMADWSVLYLTDVVKAEPFLGPIAQGCFSGAMMIGRFFGDKLRAKFTTVALVTLGSIASLVGMLFLIFIPTLLFSFIGFLMVGFGLSNLVPLVFSTAGNLKNIPASVGISTASTLGYSGFLIGPPIIGYLSDYVGDQDWWPYHGLQFGLGVVLFLFAVLLLLNLTLFRFSLKKEVQSAD